MSNEENTTLDLGALGNFDFTPDWAKKEAGVTVGRTPPHRGGATGGPASGERSFSGERKPPSGRPAPGPRKKPFERRGAPRPFERFRPLAVDVKILPETSALGTIIRKIQHDSHAYKLKDLARFFLGNPQSVLLKLTPKKPESPDAAPVVFHQCTACGFVATDAEALVAHAVADHLGDYYAASEIDVEPPKGTFTSVAKCGLSGVWLGPPNLHAFNATVREMVRTRYPDMTEAEYRARIEIVRDAEAIEEWRRGAVRQTVYTRAGAPEAAPLSREQAEGAFRRLILPTLTSTPKHAMATAAVALRSPSRALTAAVREALDGNRALYDMMFALRGAFHNRAIHSFRANDVHGPEFFCARELKAFDAAHAIPELARVATFIAENPCSTKAEIAPDAETEKQLNWLVTTGHVVAFTNGVYSAVEKHPKFGPQWRTRKTKAPDAPAAHTQEEPNHETAAELAE
jgi:hypothetical protein